jgi:hypothetical protein
MDIKQNLDSDPQGQGDLMYLMLTSAERWSGK